MRLNPEGIPRDQLRYALSQRRFVMTARRIDACLLCRNPRVNESGLCEVCYALLTDEELRLASRWLSGEGP